MIKMGYSNVNESNEEGRSLIVDGFKFQLPPEDLPKLKSKVYEVDYKGQKFYVEHWGPGPYNVRIKSTYYMHRASAFPSADEKKYCQLKLRTEDMENWYIEDYKGKRGKTKYTLAKGIDKYLQLAEKYYQKVMDQRRAFNQSIDESYKASDLELNTFQDIKNVIDDMGDEIDEISNNIYLDMKNNYPKSLSCTASNIVYVDSEENMDFIDSLLEKANKNKIKSTKIKSNDTSSKAELFELSNGTKFISKEYESIEDDYTTTLVFFDKKKINDILANA